MSPKYTVSHHCTRELLLADLLRKPIIPVVFDAVPWPPRGAMALVFSQLVYVDMKGTAVRAFRVRTYAIVVFRCILFCVQYPVVPGSKPLPHLLSFIMGNV